MLIGVDFGGTQVKAGVVEGGEVLRSTTAATRAGASPGDVLDLLASTVLSLSQEPEAVGIAIPGEVDAEGRCWRLTNVPGFAGIHVAEELSRRLGGCPIAVENDATSAALGERLYGHGREHPSFLMVTLGTGIGAGLVLGHMLYPGANGFAGEFGHLNIDRSPEAPLCACGQRGCVEAYTGTKALIRRYKELSGLDVEGVLPIAHSARRGESAGRETFAMMGDALGRGLAAVQNLLDLNAIVFTGGISGSFDLITQHVRGGLRAHTFAPPLAEVPLLLSDLGEVAGIIGAAYFDHALMQAIVVVAPGGTEQLQLASVPDPSPAAHEVLIEVHASALNRADLLQRRGLYPAPAGESDVLGLECAGVVRALGRDASRFQVGQRVMALLPGGGYAELARVHENLLLPIPERLSFEEAAAVPEAFLTAYEALLRTANLAPGERVLIHAGASGVGSAALQIAAEIGAYVFATSKGQPKLDKLRELGVQRVIDYEQEDFAEVIASESRGVGVDVIADLIGAAYAERNQKALAAGGRWVVVGVLGGARASIDFAQLLLRRQTLAGIVMRARHLSEKTAIVRGFQNDLWPWLAEGRLRPVLDQTFALADAALAHERMEQNQNIGKIVLRVR